MKLVKKIGNHLTNLCKLPIPKAGCLLERLTLSTTRSPQGPVAFEEPLCISLMSGLLPEPPPAAMKQLVTSYLSSHGPNRNSKTFCSRKKKKPRKLVIQNHLQKFLKIQVLKLPLLPIFSILIPLVWGEVWKSTLFHVARVIPVWPTSVTRALQ